MTCTRCCLRASGEWDVGGKSEAPNGRNRRPGLLVFPAMEEAAEDENRELRLILWLEEEEGRRAPLVGLGMSLGLLMVGADEVLFAQLGR